MTSNNKFYSGFEYGINPPIEEFLEKGEPFYLKQKEKPDTVVICLHGYTATPYEALPIAKKCYDLGMDAVGPIFPGHSIKEEKMAKKAMNSVKWESWVSAVESEISIARKEYKNVFLFGQSMGGGVATIIAEKNLVDAIALTAPAIKLASFSVLLWILGWLPLNIDKNKLDKADKKNDFFNVAYDFHNVRSLKQLFKLSRKARKNLDKIICPVLECHSEIDLLITPKVAHMMKNRVKGPIEIRWYNDSGHTMPLDIRGDEVSTDIANYFAKQIKN